MFKKDLPDSSSLRPHTHTKGPVRKLGDADQSTDDKRFADSDAILDKDGDPNDAIDKRLNDVGNPPGSRSATSI
jgi:hypothetical protein